MLDSRKQGISEALAKEVKRLGSQAKAAAAYKISAAQVNFVVNRKDKDASGKYPVSDSAWSALSTLLGMSNKGWQVGETRNFRRITAICGVAQMHGDRVGFIGNPALGKTEALKTYRKTYKGVIYVECEGYMSKHALLDEICKAMGRNAVGSIYQRMNQIIDGINGMEKPLIIFDEFDKLKDGVAELFKTFYNKTSAGIVLAGTPALEVKYSKGASKDKIGYKEILSRAGGEWERLYPVGNKDVEAVAMANGVTDRKELNMVINAAGGDLRKVRRLVTKMQLKARQGQA